MLVQEHQGLLTGGMFSNLVVISSPGQIPSALMAHLLQHMLFLRIERPCTRRIAVGGFDGVQVQGWLAFPK